MDSKFVVAGLVAVLVVAVLAVAFLGQQSEKHCDDAPSNELVGYWYTVDGDVFVEGIGVQDMLSDDCEIPVNFTNLRIDEAEGNAFYGMLYTERVVGTYFDDGRFFFKYPVIGTDGISTDETFKGYYSNGLIYGMSNFVYDFEDGPKECMSTFVLAKNPADKAKLTELPSIEGKWGMFGSEVLTGDKSFPINSGSLTITSLSESGLFECNMEIDANDFIVDGSLYGVLLNAPIHGKYYGFLLNPADEQIWDLTFDGETISTLAIVRTSNSSNLLTSVTCSYSPDGTGAVKDYPVIPKGIYYSNESVFSCVPGGVGTIEKSNTPFMINVTEQDGPCFSGTVIIDGTSFPTTGVIDAQGHITICYLAGTWVDYAYGDYHDGELEICASIFTSYLGRCARYVDMSPMPENEFIEDAEKLLGSWIVSSFAAPSGEIDTIFSESMHQIPLYVFSVEDGIVRGYLFNTEFIGTYGPTSTGHGSIWIHLPYKGGVFSGEMVATHNGLLFATFSYMTDDSTEMPDICQIIYTKDNQYSPVPNHGVDIFDKSWEIFSGSIWDGTQVTSVSTDSIGIYIDRTPMVEDEWGLESFFDLTITGVTTQTIRGAFHDVDVYGNGVANLYGIHSDCLSLCYYEGKVYFLGSIVYDGKMISFDFVFREKGSTDDSLYKNEFYDIKDKTFKDGDFQLTVTDQVGPFVYGTITSVYNDTAVEGNFIGLQMNIGGPVYIETVLQFKDGKIWDANIILDADDTGNVTNISFEAIWYDMHGGNYAIRVIANC